MITEYVKGNPYFTDTDKKLKQFSYLDKNIECEVLIIGGGIDAAISLYYMQKSGVKCVLIEKNRIGHQSTSCATALLEYQFDDHANDLKKYLTKEEIINGYKLGLKALKDISNFIKEYGNYCHYSPRPTLLFSQKDSEVEELKREYEFRKKNGFNADFLQQKNKFNFDFKAGIYCEDGGAEFNPYLFCNQMILEAEKLGAKVYENTEAIKISYDQPYNTVETNYGYKIICKKIIAATGYNTKLFTSKKMCTKFISYAIVTSPLQNAAWYKRTLLQDNSDPYHYLRLSPDNRIILGGEDILFKNDTIKENKAKSKYKKLNEFLLKLFPKIAGSYKIDYEFCGAFSSTLNNLAVMGPAKDNKNLWYCLGYGANGIIYSVVGAQMLAGLYKGKVDSMLKLFSPDREV